MNTISAVTISDPITATVGENIRLQCSVDITPTPLPQNTPFPTFDWYFGRTNTSLPSGATVSNVTKNGKTYTSTLQFSPLLVSHAGMYTCRLGGNASRVAAANTNISEHMHAPLCCGVIYTAVM